MDIASSAGFLFWVIDRIHNTRLLTHQVYIELRFDHINSAIPINLNISDQMFY